MLNKKLFEGDGVIFNLMAGAVVVEYTDFAGNIKKIELKEDRLSVAFEIQ